MSEQRSAPEALAQRLDLALPPGRKTLPPMTPDPLVNMAAELARLSIPELLTESSRRIETRMLAAFEAQYHVRVQRRPRRAETVLRWALVASLAFALLVGLTPAVAASLPGEPLYSVKQLYEKIELATATTPAAKASVYLQHADRRTQEALILLERNQFDSALIVEAFSDIAAAGNSESDVRASARLRGQLLQVETALEFVLQDAEQGGLASQANTALLSRQLEQIQDSDLLLPPVTATPDPAAFPTNTDLPTEQASETSQPTRTPRLIETPHPTRSPQPTETPHPTRTPASTDETPTCPSQGNACNSQGVPGGQVNPPTHRPTHTPRIDSPMPRPTHTPRSNPPTQPVNPGEGNPVGNGNGGGNGNGAGNSNAGGNSNGSENPNVGGNGIGVENSNAGGSGNGAENANAGGNSNGSENPNAGGNGNGAENSNAGGNGNGNGGGHP